MSVAVRRANAGTDKPVVAVKGDGNCFFRSAIVACNLKNVCAFPLEESQHLVLRNLVVDFAEHKGYTFAPFLNIEYSSKAEWLVEMRKNSIWADNLAIIATSDFLEIPIQIVGINGNALASFGEQYMYASIDRIS